MGTYYVFVLLLHLCHGGKEGVDEGSEHTILENKTISQESVDKSKEHVTLGNKTISQEEAKKISERIKMWKKAIRLEGLVLPTDPPKENISFADLDKRIVKAILHPKRNVDMGLQLLKDTYFYYSELDDLADAMETDFFAGVTAVLDSGAMERPKFVDLKYNETELQIIYSWDEKEVTELFSNIIGSRYVWDKVQKLLLEPPDPPEPPPPPPPTRPPTTTTMRTTVTTFRPFPNSTIAYGNYTKEISAETIEFSEVPISKEEDKKGETSEKSKDSKKKAKEN